MAYTLGRFTIDELGFIQVVPARILVASAKGDIDLNLLAREELANRGLDQAGVWVITLFLFVAAFFMLLSLSCNRPSRAVAADDDLARFVNPFVGTRAHGHTYPGAARPFGMVQHSPDTRLDGWDGCSGYHFTDTIVYGFSHTHLSGTGVSDYGDVLLMPFTVKVLFHNGADGQAGYASAFDKSSESASPGYYKVRLKKNNIEAELTATPRTGLHRYTFPAGDAAGLLIDREFRLFKIGTFHQKRGRIFLSEVLEIAPTRAKIRAGLRAVCSSTVDRCYGESAVGMFDENSSCERHAPFGAKRCHARKDEDCETC